MFNPIFMVLLFGMLVFAIVGLVKENRIHMKYQKVFGRVSSYLFADFILVGVFAIIAMIISPFIPEVSNMIAGNYLLYAGMGVLVLLLGIVIYLFARRKCPAYLKKSLFINMLLDGLGIALKISLFFLPFIFRIGTPSAEEVAAEERRREEERLALERQKEETRKDLYRKTGKNYILNDDGDRAKLPYKDYQKVNDILDE